MLDWLTREAKEREGMDSMKRACTLTIFLVIGAAFFALDPVAAEVDWQACGNSLPDYI